MCKAFTRLQRTKAALTHYTFEQVRYTREYRDAVYRKGGLTLWSAQLSNTCYALKLVDSRGNRHEGGIGVVLLANGTCLSEVICLAGRSVLGMKRGIVPFITRNQSINSGAPELSDFRSTFPHNSPKYFCLAAIQGIAGAHGISRMAAIKHDQQISFRKGQAASFQNSYSNLWQQLGAAEGGRHAYSIPVPFPMSPIDAVEAKHRNRAKRRRAIWAQILEQTAHAVSAKRRLAMWPSSTNAPPSAFLSSCSTSPLGTK